MKKIITNLINLFAGGYQWISIFVSLILFFTANATGMESTDSSEMIFKLMLLSRVDKIEYGELCSAEFILTAFRENYWLLVLFPFLSSFCALNKFSDNWIGSEYYFNVARSGKKRFAIIEMISAFLMGFLTLEFSLAIYGGIVLLSFPKITEFEGYEMGLVAFVQGASSYDRVGYILKIFIQTGFLAGIASLFSVLLMILLNDRFFAITVPVIISYLSTKVSNFLALYLRDNVSDPSDAMNNLILLIPTDYLNLDGILINEASVVSRIGLLLFLFASALALMFINTLLIVKRDR
ncbi:MAG: hypothetical protein VZR23_07215 [Lachnospiraceae bacterium]|nr:hypothetical protein [Lachnospiraceae bacterium]